MCMGCDPWCVCGPAMLPLEAEGTLVLNPIACLHIHTILWQLGRNSFPGVVSREVANEVKSDGGGG